MRQFRNGELRAAAQSILDAGCSGTAQLTWNIRYCLNEDLPAYPPGDAAFDDTQLHRAVEAALRLYAKWDGATDPILEQRMILRAADPA